MRSSISMLGLFSTVSLALALPAAALPGISLSEPVPATGPDECSVLSQIKYPWLACATGADGAKRFVGGTIAANAGWDDDRQIPLGHEFVEGHGNWLPVTQ
jgi:hypothetical protein